MIKLICQKILINSYIKTENLSLFSRTLRTFWWHLINLLLNIMIYWKYAFLVHPVDRSDSSDLTFRQLSIWLYGLYRYAFSKVCRLFILLLHKMNRLHYWLVRPRRPVELSVRWRRRVNTALLIICSTMLSVSSLILWFSPIQSRPLNSTKELHAKKLSIGTILQSSSLHPIYGKKTSQFISK